MSDFTETAIPANTFLASIESERRGQEAFARTRRRAYVKNPKILNNLDQFVEDGIWRQDSASSSSRSLPLVITGGFRFGQKCTSGTLE